METENKGKNDYKNDETSQYIVTNNYISRISDFDKIIHSKNFEEYSISFSGIDNSKSKVVLKDDEINSKCFDFLRSENNSINQNRNAISNPSIIIQPKKFEVLRKKRGRKEQKIIFNKERKEKIHNKYGKDNIIRKCQISYFDFIIHFINIIITINPVVFLWILSSVTTFRTNRC